MAGKTKAAREAEAATPLTARAFATDDGTVKISLGKIKPVEEFEEGQTEHEWDEDSSFELSTDAADDLATSIGTAAQDARTSGAAVADRGGLAVNTDVGLAAHEEEPAREEEPADDGK